MGSFGIFTFFARASAPYAQTVRLVSRSPPFTPLRLS